MRRARSATWSRNIRKTASLRNLSELSEDDEAFLYAYLTTCEKHATSIAANSRAGTCATLFDTTGKQQRAPTHQRSSAARPEEKHHDKTVRPRDRWNPDRRDDCGGTSSRCRLGCRPYL